MQVYGRAPSCDGCTTEIFTVPSCAYFVRAQLAVTELFSKTSVTFPLVHDRDRASSTPTFETLILPEFLSCARCDFLQERLSAYGP